MKHSPLSLSSIYHRLCELRIARGILQLLRAISKFVGTQTPKLRPSQKVAPNFRATFGRNFVNIVPLKIVKMLHFLSESAVWQQSQG